VSGGAPVCAADCRKPSSFSGTIRDNIAYGRHDATDEQIATAATLANADEFIARMPGGDDARIASGERASAPDTG
jgi:ABC-type multidrug transport system fused ATPase/permease subunit